ncbi:hypothetical protein [Phocaeicola vulgatus]|uniref:hypothetical protein n=2 Tax=Phocaeicola vulgatus TaxID=821 RepID=UPI0035666E98
MSDLNLENIVGFKAVDKDGNEQNVTVDEMVDMVSTRMVMALSETSTFAAAAATGNDVYENELPTVTDAANVRVLQSSGDAAKMTMQSLASKLGELLENRLVKYKEMNLGANEIIDTGANTGLIRFKINATSASCVFFCNSGSSNIMLITQNVDNYFTTNKSSNSEKIAIYKESDNGNILIKNLTAINYGTFVFYYI